MIRRLRRRARAVLLVLAALVCAPLAGQVVKDVVSIEVKWYVWAAILTTVGSAILLGAGFFAWILSRDREQTHALVGLSTAATERLADRMEEALMHLSAHKEAKDAHSAALSEIRVSIATLAARDNPKSDETLRRLSAGNVS